MVALASGIPIGRSEGLFIARSSLVDFYDTRTTYPRANRDFVSVNKITIVRDQSALISILKRLSAPLILELREAE